MSTPKYKIRVENSAHQEILESAASTMNNGLPYVDESAYEALEAHERQIVDKYCYRFVTEGGSLCRIVEEPCLVRVRE